MSVKWHMFAASKALSSMRDKAAILKFFVKLNNKYIRIY